MKLHIFELARTLAKNFHPVLQLSKEGRKAHPQTKAKGILYGITSTGKLRVRMIGTKTVITYDPSMWQYSPDQTTRSGETVATRAMKKFIASKTLLIPEVSIKTAAKKTPMKPKQMPKPMPKKMAGKVLHMNKHRRAKRAA